MKPALLAARLHMTLIALTLLAGQANALSLRFKSKIFSSGPMIYACNAGVASAHPRGQVCYFEGKKEMGMCTPLTCDAAKENCDTQCVCTTTPGGEIPAYLVAHSVPYLNNLAPSGPQLRKDVVGTAFESLFSNAEAWKQKIFNVGAYFAQEQYTGAYFVDICWRGSQIPDTRGYFAISTQAAAIPFEVLNVNGFHSLDNNRANLNFDLAGVLGTEYTSKANLTVQTFVKCGSTIADADFNSVTGVPTNADHSTSETALRSSAQTVDHGGVIDPKFCKVRYVFRETDYLKATPSIRSHAAQGAEVCTYTVINDPPKGNAISNGLLR